MRKKVLIPLVLVLSITMLFALESEKLSNADVFSCETVSSGRTYLQFSTPEWSSESFEAQQGNFSKIQIAERDIPFLTASEGLPELPFFSTMIAVPDHGSINLDGLDLAETRVPIDPVYPYQDLEAQRSVLAMDQSFYESGSVYPAETVHVGEPVIMRNLRMVPVNVYPFAYDPQTSELIVRDDISFEINADNSIGVNEVDMERPLSRSFEPMYRSLVLNYDDVRDENPVYQNPSIIILTCSSSEIDEQVEQLADWKRTKGFDVTVVSTSETGNSTNSILSYIDNAYGSWENPPEYVVIVGDAGGSFDVPTWGGEGDHNYTCLEGNDILPEIFVGRLSISSPTDLMVILQKINLYERDPNLNEEDMIMYRHSLLVGDTSPSGLSCVITSKYNKEEILSYDPDHSFTELYDPDPSASQMGNAINAGSLFFSYRGYYGMSGWISSTANSLTNVNKLTNAVIITCDTGTFASSSGVARTEALLRVGTPTAPKGAACAIGMSTASTHTQYNNILMAGIFHGLYASDMHTMGQAIMAGKLYLYLGYSSVNYSAVSDFTEWCNLMGDPCMDVWRGEPIAMSAEYDSSIDLGQGYIDVNVFDYLGEPLEGAWVTARMGQDIIFGTGLTDDAGTVTITFDPYQIGNVNLTITKPDYIPHLGSFSVESSGGIACTNVAIDDDNTGSSSGNNNGEANSGETVELFVNLHNYSETSAANVSAEISSNDPWIEITQNADDFGTISAGGNMEGQSGFVVEIAPDAPDKHILRFNLDISDENGNTWSNSFWLEIKGNDADVEEVQYADGNDGVIDPGETSDIVLTIRNNGGTVLDGVYGTLRTSSYFLRVDDSLAYFGSILPGSQASCGSDPFTVTGLSLTLPGMTVKARLRLFNDSGYEEFEDVVIQVGEAHAGDPTGPDSYGYVCYDSGDTDYLEAPVYDWIEIDPAFGGEGNDTGISDTGDEGEEYHGKATVDLPFDFNFYGKTYSEVTICSNGWITFVDTEQVSFRNWYMPGAMGPRAMIAAFWDDLRTGSGGVYTWFNEDEDYFVIQWSRVQNAVDSAAETFQIILYNPEVYLTPTFDGMIKIQYMTFNNVDSYNSSGGSQGNHCTVGIEDHTELRGLQYTYDDEYANTSMPIQNETAILFTGLPMSSQESYLVYNGIVMHDEDESGLVDAGESVDLSVRIDNVGLSTATGIVGTISSDSPYISITNATSNYGNINSSYSGYNLSFFSFDVLPTCPNQHIAHFTIELNNDDGYWEYPFAIIVYKPTVELLSTIIYDTTGNMDGVFDPGEEGYLIVNLQNNTGSLARDVTATLSVNNDLITIGQPEFSYGDLGVGMNLQKAYPITVDATIPAETIVLFSLDIDMYGGTGQAYDFQAGIGIWGAQSDFEDDNWGFSSSDFWEWGTPSLGTHSGEKAWATRLYANYLDNADWRLESTEFYIGTCTELHFWHKYQTQTNYDGGNVKISIDGGFTWHVVEPNDGYPTASMSSSNDALGGEPGYSGYHPEWAEAVFDLSAYAGHNGIIRWHFGTNGSTIAYGWIIDDVLVTGSQEKGAGIAGTVTLSENMAEVEDALVTVGQYTTQPDEEGNYLLYVSENTYDLKTDLQYFESDLLFELAATQGTISEGNDMVLTYLHPATSTAWEQQNGRVTITWDYEAPSAVRNNKSRKIETREEFESFRVYRQQETGPNVLVGSDITDYQFVDQIDSLKTYFYTIVVQYDAGLSEPAAVEDVYWDGTIVGTQPDAPSYVNRLGCNYPNPFNPETRIDFSLKNAGRAKLDIFNVKGQLVKTLVDDKLTEGNHSFTWHGTDNSNHRVSSGVYLYRLETDGYRSIRKMLLLK